MDVSSVTGGIDTSSNASTSFTGLADDFSTFLTLLTTQLQNQDPLDPTDTNEFTNQLVAFSQVEQQIRANQNLEDLTRITQQNNVANLAGLLGNEARVEHASGTHEGNGVKWQVQFNLPVDASTYQIQDAAGNIVAQFDGATSRGVNDFTWDGTLGDGSTAPDGVYTLAVTARDDQNNPVDARVTVEDTITAINPLTGELRIADQEFGFTDLERLVAG